MKLTGPGPRFDACDAWLMFCLWAAASGHFISAAIAALICIGTAYGYVLNQRDGRKETP